MSEELKPEVIETVNETLDVAQETSQETVEKTVEEVVEEAAEVAVEAAPEAVEEVKEEVKEEAAAPKAVLYGKAVDDIRRAISLGDRFLYQRELFGQDVELMQRTLTELNELGSYDEAVEYISSHFEWDTESSTYQQFLVTLHRRFG